MSCLMWASTGVHALQQDHITAFKMNRLYI
jgi:hypothetical protein